VVLLLVLGCIVMFALVLKMPLAEIRSYVWPQEKQPEVTQIPKPPATKPAKRVHQPSVRVEASRTANKFANTSNTSPKIGKEKPTSSPSRPLEPLRSVLAISELAIPKDSVAMYRMNSSQGPVVKVLSGGTIVEPKIQVTDAADNWTLVRIQDSNIFGFVRTESLISPTPQTNP
jgi:hypothetical protein